MSENQKTVDSAARRENLRWWIKLCLQPLLFFVAGLLLLFTLGVAQRMGFLTTEGEPGTASNALSATGGNYICPMMCVPPLSAPGRCPVCAMQLVPASTRSASDDPLAVQIAPATRRIANIQTTPVRRVAAVRDVKTVGVISYNESTEKTIASYVSGRLDELHADYTGMEVEQGDPLALIYSQELYSAQAELIEAIRSQREGGLRSELLQSVDLVEAASEKLRLLGLSDTQVMQLKSRTRPSKHIAIDAPISGTVTTKLASQGDYVREGQALLKVADLSTVWLILELFPDDAALAEVGQRVSATVASYPGRVFQGTVEFISPLVDPKTRTVGVRVLMDNALGQLKVGDYADATLQVPLGGGKANDDSRSEVLAVPRDAVLYAGEISVVYVETTPGRFEIRPVTLGHWLGQDIVIQDGLELGDLVASRGNFLIDSQMQLAGNPSLIDPRRLESTLRAIAEKRKAKTPSEQELVQLGELSEPDRQAAIDQAICPISMMTLGSMGVPPKVDVDGQAVFICCEACRDQLLKSPDSYLAKLQAAKRSRPEPAAGSGIVEVPAAGEIESVEADPDSGRPALGRPEKGPIMEIEP